MAQYYVRAKSKKEINDKLTEGKIVYGTSYSPFSSETKALTDLNNGDVITVYEKMVGGNPFGKAYGTWDSKKGRLK